LIFFLYFGLIRDFIFLLDLYFHLRIKKVGVLVALTNGVVGTYMENHAKQLMFENISKNKSDIDEYLLLMQMHSHSVSIMANI
jgi:hypothetical protein